MNDDHWRIELFGHLLARRGGVASRPLSAKSAALLAWLALRHDTSHTREALSTMLWPEASPQAGRHRLRTAIYDVRRLLEPAPATPGSALRAGRESVRLVPGTFETDVGAFLAAAGEVETAPEGDRQEALRRALALFGGELLPGFYEPWILAERDRLAAVHTGLLRRLLSELVAQGATDEAIEISDRLLAIDPFDESVQLQLMRLYARAGRIGAALAQYRSYAAQLADELDAEPSDDVIALVTSLRQASPDQRVGPRRSPLPAPLTGFVGREDELSHIRSHLVDGGSRLVTIVGPGGIGKTRLAIEFARRVRSTDGVAITYVELADVVDESYVADSVAAASGAAQSAGGDPIEAFASTVAADARPLLVIDNAERVGPAVATAVEHAIERVPALRVLVTSRRPLGIGGEVEVRLGPLPVPVGWEEPADLGTNASVRMYVDRVRAKRSDFELTSANAAAVARLCTRLEGIPLALELAAVRERVLPASRLVGMLERRFDVLVGAQRDVRERHRTLSAAIDWSFHALDAETRTAFTRLSVFRGGWSLEQAEDVAGVPAVDAALDRMCDVSLVEAFDRGGARRFRMLETIREFAIDRLDAAEVTTLGATHAAVFLRLAENASEQLSRSEQGVWLEQLDADIDNVRAALDWFRRAGDGTSVVRIVIALNRYWMARSRQREARRWLHDALTADELERALVRRGFRYAGELALSEGDLAEAERCLERAAALGGDDDPRTAGYILSGLGHIAARHGRFDDARGLLVRGLAIATETGDDEVRACIANDLGVLAARSGDYRDALERFAESLAAYRALGDDTSVVVLSYNLGYLATITREFDRAQAFLDESLRTSRRLAHVGGIATATTFEGLLEFARGRFDAAAIRSAEAAELCLDIGEENRLVLALEGIGCALESLGEDGLAARALGHARSLRETVEIEELFEDARVVAGAVERITARLGDESAARELAAGRDASTEQVLDWVRERE